jgi:solute carrier family 40 (iron-regulated transporter), member 1
MPSAYYNVSILYTMHLFFAFVSRMWDIGIVLLVANLTGSSLFIVALSGLMSSLTVFLFSPTLGSWFDSNDRLVAMKVALTVKFFSVTTGYALCAYLLSWNDTEAVLNGFEIYAVPVVCALANLSFAMVTMSVEKDWVVVLSGGDSEWLSSTNSVLTQIDLACNAVAPAVTGVLFSFLTYRVVALALLILNAVTAFGLYVFLHRLYLSWPALMCKTTKQLAVVEDAASAVDSVELERRMEVAEVDIRTEGASSPPNSPVVHAHYHTGTVMKPPSFLGSGVAGPMVAYACLYFTVLSFSSLMMVYLKWSGLQDHWIGVARGIAALSGFLGAFIYPYAKAAMGLVQSGRIFIWWQCILVGIAASSVVVFNGSIYAVKIMVICVLTSRIGLWAFDLCVRQMAQEGVAEVHRGAVNGKWRSLIAFFDLSSYAVAVMCPDPEDFWILTSISAIMIFIAAVTYTVSTSESCNNFCLYSTILQEEEVTPIHAMYGTMMV